MPNRLSFCACEVMIVGVLVVCGGPVSAQTSTTKEYIRLGGRVIAIENTAGTGTGAVSISGVTYTPGLTNGLASAAGVSGSFTVTSTLTPTQTWTVTPDPGNAVVSVNNGSCGTAPPASPSNPVESVSSVSYCFWLMPNTTLSQRTIKITVAGGASSQTLSTNQDTVAFTPANVSNAPATGQQVVVQVSSTLGTNWMAQPTTSTSWAHIISPTATSFTLSLDPQPPNSNARNGIIDIVTTSGSPAPSTTVATFNVSQAGNITGSCSVGTTPQTSITGLNPATGEMWGHTSSYTMQISQSGTTCGTTPTVTVDTGAGGGSWLTIVSVTAQTTPPGSFLVTFQAALNQGNARAVNILGCSGSACTPAQLVTLTQAQPVFGFYANSPLVENQATPLNVTIDGSQAQLGDVSGPTQIAWVLTGGGTVCPPAPGCSALANAPLFTAPSQTGTVTVTGTWLGHSQNTSITVIPPPPPTGIASIKMLSSSGGSVIASGTGGDLNVTIVSPSDNYILVGPAGLNYPSSCYLLVQNSYLGTFLALLDDQGNQSSSNTAYPPHGGSGWTYGSNIVTTLSNSRCSIDLTQSTWSTNGNTITLDLAVALSETTMAGLQILWGKNPDSGWTMYGTFSVPPVPVLGITQLTVPGCPANSPSCTGGAVVATPTTFTVSAQAANSVSNIQFVDLTIGGTTSTFSLTTGQPWSCDIRYYPASNTYKQADDNGNMTPVAGSTYQQCSVPNPPSMTTNSATNTITVTFPIDFHAGFNNASQGHNGFVGIHQVTATVVDTSNNIGATLSEPIMVAAEAIPPVVVSATPSSGSGSSQQFTFVYSDGLGYSALGGLWMIFDKETPQPTDLGGCTGTFLSGPPQFVLWNSNGTAWAGSVYLVNGQFPTGTSPLTNGNCSVSNVSATPSGDTYTIAANLTFSDPPLSGLQQIWGLAIDVNGTDSGNVSWTGLGTWTVAPSTTPSFSLSATPANPSSVLSTGGSATSTVTVTPTGGFSAPVTLTTVSWPSGISGVFSPTSTSSTSTLTITVAAGTPVNTYQLQISGSGGGVSAPSSPAYITLVVSPTSTSGTVTVTAFQYDSPTVGQPATYPILVQSQGYSGSVSFSFSAVSPSGSGIGCTANEVFVSSNGSASATATCSVPSALATPRTFDSVNNVWSFPSYTTTLTATAGSGTPQNLVLTMVPKPTSIQGYAIVSSPSLSLTPTMLTAGTPYVLNFTVPWAVNSDGSANDGGPVFYRFQDPAVGPNNAGAHDCTVSMGSNGAVILDDDTGAPQSLTWAGPYVWATNESNSQCSVPFQQAAFTASYANQELLFSLPVMFSTNWSGKTLRLYVRTTSGVTYTDGGWKDIGVLSVASNAPSFSLSATTASPASVAAGGTATATVTVNGANGFNSPVTLAPLNWPSGITAAFSPNPTGGSSGLTINVGSAVAPGNYSLAVTGQSGSLNATNNPYNVALTVTGSTGGACGNGYGYCRSLTLNHNLAGTSPSPNFPVVLANNFPWMAIGGTGHVLNQTTQGSGGAPITVPADLVFAADATCSSSSLYSWEFESYTPSTGQAVVWIKVPTLSNTTDTVIFACYGNSSKTTWQGNVNGTWDSSYKAVYHMNNAVTTGGQTITDSTSSANNLTTAVAGASSFAQIGGKIYKALHFVPANQFYGASAQSASVSGAGTGPLTLEMWVNPVNLTSLDGGSEGQDVGVYNSTATPASGTFVAIGATAAGNVNQIAGIEWDDQWHTDFVAGQAVSTPNTWYHVVLAYDGSASTTMYVNNVSIGTYSGSVPRNDGPISISGYVGAWGYRSVDFAIEEFRVSATYRNAAWVTASYNSQSAPNSFVTVGSEMH